MILIKVNFYLAILTLSCSLVPDHEKVAVKKLDESAVVQRSFGDFSQGFNEVDLPITLNVESKMWIDLNSEKLKEIDRSDALNFLFNNDSKGITQADGGFYQFYFMYKYNISDESIGLIYYKTGTQVSGFWLSIHNMNGSKLDELYLAGSIGEFDMTEQREALIGKSGEIEVQNLELINESSNSALLWKCSYKIDSNGNLNVQHSSDSTVNIKMRDESPYRWVITE